MMIFLSDRVALFDRAENTVERGENAFSPFPKVYSKAFLFRVVKSQNCVIVLDPMFL